MIRSGDVIPYIMDVLEPAEHVMMPNEDYEWYGDTHVDIVLKDKGSNKAVLIKNLVFFFKTLEIDGLGPGNVERIEKSGFDTIPKILAMKPDDLRLVDGFKEKMAQKVHTNIHAAIDQAKLVDIMAASNLFGHGMGKRKMVAILDDYPDALTSDETDDQKIDKIMKIKSMAQKSARLFVCNIKEFLAFLDEIGLSGMLVVPPSNKSPIDVDHPLYKKSVVMTGFRDAELSKKLDKVGAKIGSSVSKNTFVLVVKTEGEKTGKVDQAESLGVVVMSVDKFKQLYF
jgi:NAD-dependent DNA ligase